ncbi:hypothetical protein Ciccas_013158, partial [Cichlidogyrus casuarinus]
MFYRVGGRIVFEATLKCPEDFSIWLLQYCNYVKNSFFIDAGESKMIEGHQSIIARCAQKDCPAHLQMQYVAEHTARICLLCEHNHLPFLTQATQAELQKLKITVNKMNCKETISVRLSSGPSASTTGSDQAAVAVNIQNGRVTMPPVLEVDEKICFLTSNGTGGEPIYRDARYFLQFPNLAGGLARPSKFALDKFEEQLKANPPVPKSLVVEGQKFILVSAKDGTYKQVPNRPVTKKPPNYSQVSADRGTGGISITSVENDPLKNQKFDVVLNLHSENLDMEKMERFQLCLARLNMEQIDFILDTCGDKQQEKLDKMMGRE